MQIEDVIRLAIEAGGSYTESNTIPMVMEILAKRRGWDVKREFLAPTNGRRGRVDLLVREGAFSAAVEVDGKSIKKKSVAKLLSLDVTARICVLSRGTIDQVPEGIDAVVSISAGTVITRDAFAEASG